MSSINAIFIGLAAAAVGIILGFIFRKVVIEKRTAGYDAQGRKLINDALAEVEQMKKEASIQIKDDALQQKQETEKEIRKRKNELVEEEKRFSQ